MNSLYEKISTRYPIHTIAHGDLLLTRVQYGEIVDVRFPSLKYNTHRRFCYVQFKSSGQARAATERDGEVIGKLKLVAKISDPGVKQDRQGAVHEGRELYVANLDWSATEDEVKQVFSKYGTVEKIRIPTNIAGKSKGIAFVVFSNRVVLHNIFYRSLH